MALQPNEFPSTPTNGITLCLLCHCCHSSLLAPPYHCSRPGRCPLTSGYSLPIVSSTGASRVCTSTRTRYWRPGRCSLSRPPFPRPAASAKLSARDRRLVANAVDRSVCIALSDRFHIVLPPQTADLTVHVTIANIVPTDETAAATSKVLDIGKSVLTNTGVIETSVPIPSVRVPIGLGGIALGR